MPTPATSGSPRSRMEVLRYLAVGAWNTVFGYACYAGLTALFTDRIPEAYLAASLLSNVISVTVAFLGYKWFVFRTKGNYFREWVRCVGVYSFSIVLSLIALPPMVHLLRREPSLAGQSPYIAGAAVIGLSILFSYIGHKHFSFRPARDGTSGRAILP